MATVSNLSNVKDSPYVGLDYVARRLNVSKRTVKNMIKDGRLRQPIGKHGRCPVWNKQTIDHHIDTGKYLTK